MATTEENDSTKEDLAGRLARGTAWTGGANVVAKVLSLLASVVVARHLDPSEYGTAAAALTVVAFAQVFTHFGLGPAIASGRLGGESAIVSAHWLICGLGTIFGGLVALSAAPAARFFEEPAAGPVVIVAGGLLPTLAAAVVPTAVLQRRDRFRTIAGITVASQLLAAIAAVTMAYSGAGVWALIVPRVAAGLLQGVLLWARSAIAPRPRFAFETLRGHLVEGGQVTGAALSTYLFRNADNVIIGKLFGLVALGRYAFAYGLLNHFMGIFSGSVAAPMLASLGTIRSRTQRVDRAVVGVSLALARLTFPAGIGAAALAPTLIPTVFGPQWTESVPYVQVFLTLGAIHPLGSLSGSVWLALGYSRLHLVWGVITNLLTVVAFLIGAWLAGPLGVAVGFAVQTCFVNAPAILVVMRRACGLELEGLTGGLARVARDAGIMGIVVWILERTLSGQGFHGWTTLALGIPAGIVVYVALIRCFSADELTQLLARLPERLRDRASRVLRLPTGGAAT